MDLRFHKLKVGFPTSIISSSSKLSLFVGGHWNKGIITINFSEDNLEILGQIISHETLHGVLNKMNEVSGHNQLDNLLHSEGI